MPPDVEKMEDLGLPQTSWVLDKHIPIALLCGILLQTFFIGWFMSSLNGRVDVLERQAAASAPISERLVKLETKFDSVSETLTEIKNILRQPPSRAGQ